MMSFEGNGQITSEHLTKIEARVRGLFNALHQNYKFHDLAHTEAVVNAVREIGKHEDITDHQRMLVEAAAWFHDVGYLRSVSEHEELSAFASLVYLMRIGVGSDDIEVIESCIMATRLGSKPVSVLQKVIADADMWHLSTPEYLEWAERLRLEWKAMRDLEYTDNAWLKNNIGFMRTVQYHSKYGREVLMPRMQANIQTLIDTVGE